MKSIPIMRTMALSVGLVGAVGLSGCSGNIGDTTGGSDDENGSNASAICAVDTPIRRMTRVEYNHTVRDLFGFDTAIADSFVPEEESNGFTNQASALNVTELLADQYMQAAEALSEQATQPGNLANIISCDPVADASACARSFVESFGRRAFRRPLTEDEVARYVTLYDKMVSDPDFGTFEVGIQFVIQAMLQSPHFLYRVEFGMPEPVEADVVELTDFELASRLSFLLWASMPDDELLAAADAGELRSADQLEAQARRMLADDRAREAVREFHSQWLQLHHLDAISKDTNVYPQYSDQLRELWREETESFIEHVIFDGDGNLETLFSADYTMMNAELAAFYGIDPASAPTGAAFEPVSIDPTQRAGFLTQASVLATHAKADQSSPVLRGKFIREQIMCELIPLPPNDVIIEPPALDPDKTTRELFEEIEKDPYCNGCHSLMNPVGFGFENFDGLGQWRDEQNGKPIDASGTVVGGGELAGEFDGPVQLVDRLAASEQVRECVTVQWFRYGYGRGDVEEDTCSLDQLNETFAASNYNIQELLVALTQTDAFRYRRQVVVGEAGGDQ